MITTQYGNEVELLGVVNRHAENEAITYRRKKDGATRQCQVWQLRATDGIEEIQAELDRLETVSC